MKWRKKPLVVEAIQWFEVSEDNEDEKRIVVHYYRRADVLGSSLCKHCTIKMHDHGWMETLEGGHIVCPGDFIITGIKGEHYPCKPDIFINSYEREDCV